MCVLTFYMHMRLTLAFKILYFTDIQTRSWLLFISYNSGNACNSAYSHYSSVRKWDICLMRYLSNSRLSTVETLVSACWSKCLLYLFFIWISSCVSTSKPIRFPCIISADPITNYLACVTINCLPYAILLCYLAKY